eukprot:GFUD01018614.1.p1 GENE.GFUD01018614.1~~GFUD01018614.1.p1  ORF type:complete len:266 (+),score=45.73 GFUD01018614.1:78-875(+)
MRSLRSLCLLKVHSLGLDTLDPSLMPPSLAKDIKVMRLFNKSFIDREVYLVDDTLMFGVYQDALSIQYDGASWTILYRSNHFDMDCCPHCDFVEPDLEQFTLEEGKLAPVPPQSNPENIHQRYKDLMMSASFTMEEDGTSGEIKLDLFKDSVPFPVEDKPSITIEMNASRQWVADCGGFNGVGLSPLIASVGGQYIETPDPIQDVFTTPLYHSCIRKAINKLNWDLDLTYQCFGLDDVMAAIDQVFNQQEPEEFLEDFWRLVIVE